MKNMVPTPYETSRDYWGALEFTDSKAPMELMDLWPHQPGETPHDSTLQLASSKMFTLWTLVNCIQLCNIIVFIGCWWYLLLPVFPLTLAKIGGQDKRNVQQHTRPSKLHRIGELGTNVCSYIEGCWQITSWENQQQHLTIATWTRTRTQTCLKKVHIIIPKGLLNQENLTVINQLMNVSS